jgi:hypothetical protein
MKIMIAAVFYFLYWGVCFLGTGTDRKNLIGLRSYPDEVQTRVQSDPQLGQAVPKAKSTAAILLSNLLLFTVVFSVLGLALKSVLGLNNYLSAFWYFLAFGEGLGLFDLLVIDLLWWRSTKRIRFSFLPEKKYYQDPKKHIESFWRGIPLFAAAAEVVNFRCIADSVSYGLKQYMGDAPRCMASLNTPTRECNDLPYLRT